MYAVLGNQPKVLRHIYDWLLFKHCILLQCCNVLIKNLQSKVNLKETNGNHTALMIAIIQGYAEVAKVLLKQVTILFSALDWSVAI